MTTAAVRELREYVDRRFDGIDRHLERLGEEYVAITEALRRIEARS